MPVIYSVFGVNWSGFLREYDAGKNPFVLEIRQQSGTVVYSEHKFQRVEDLEQFIDELDFFEGGDDVSY